MTQTTLSLPGPELLLCDTSYLGHSEKARRRPHLYTHWEPRAINRVSSAVLAITPFTLAEVRFGYQFAGLGPARVASIEHALAAYLLIPIDQDIMATYVDLKCERMRAGMAMGFHDCWIAATAIAKDIPLVSSDAGQNNIPGLTTISFPPPPS